MSLVVENLSVRKGSFELTLPKLKVDPGTICCLMGGSGSGKTTLLDAVAGFTPIQNGSVSFGGNRMDHLLPEKRRMALVFQSPALFPHLSVQDNVAFGLKIQKVEKPQMKSRVHEWLEKLEILELKKRFPGELSGGQAQRVALARAMVVGFPVLLLDEPFSGLDVPLRRQLRKVLKSLIKESMVSTLLVTHDPQDTLELADTVALLEIGRIIESGALSELNRPGSQFYSLLEGAPSIPTNSGFL